MKIMLKKWIYDEIQNKAFLNGKTIVWEKDIEYDANDNVVAVYTIDAESIVRETEKAICVDCKYWSHKSRYINFTEYSGLKVWIPKSAVICLKDGVLANAY